MRTGPGLSTRLAPSSMALVLLALVLSAPPTAFSDMPAGDLGPALSSAAGMSGDGSGWLDRPIPDELVGGEFGVSSLRGGRMDAPRDTGSEPDASAVAAPLDEWLARAGVPRSWWGMEPDDRDTLTSAADAAGSAAALSGNFPICNVADAVSSAESLAKPSVAYNPRRNEYLVTWQATTRAAKTNVYARFVSSSGTPLGSQFSIAETTNIELAPSVAYDSNADQYWVAWTDLGSGSTGDVKVRRYSPTGVAVGNPVVVNNAGAVAFAGRVACGAGRCIVVWNSDPGDGNGHILARSFDASANPVTAVLLLSAAVGQAMTPDIAFNTNDSNFLVVWHEYHASTGYDVMSHGITPNIASYGIRTVSAAAGDQKVARVGYSPSAGRYLVVWYDGRSQVTWDVYGQLVGRDCVPTGGVITVYAGAHHDAYPVVAGSNATGEFLVAYQRDISGATQFQIYASKVSGTGGVGSPFEVRGWYNTRYEPAIAHRNGTSDYLVGFTDDGMVTQPDIQARVVRADGTLVSSVVAVARGRKGQETPRLTSGVGTGEYLVAWGDYRSGADYDLYARRVSTSGAVLGSEIVVGSDAALYGYPDVAYSIPSEEYMVVWQEVHGPSTGYDIYARRVGVAGDVRGSAVLISRDTATYNEGAPRVVYNPNAGNYLVVWHAYTDGEWRIWGQRLSTAGALIGSNFLISASTSVTQTPHVAYGVNRNEFLVVWQDMRNGARIDIYGQRLSATGAAVGGNFAISTATGDKDGCDVAYGNTSTGYLVVFGDARSGGNNVYGQYVDKLGTLVGGNFPIASSGATETAPTVAFDMVSRKYVAAWWQFSEGSDWDVWARAVPVTGGPTEAAFAVSTANEVQNWVELEPDVASGDILFVWQDFRASSYDVYGQVVTLAETPSCSLDCSASAPSAGAPGTPVAFSGSATPSNCAGSVAYDWNFGDGTSHSSSQNPSHTYVNQGTYSWGLTASIEGVSCAKSGSITISSGGGGEQYVWWVPVVSHGAGAGGSNWRSDLGLLNRSAQGPATVTLKLYTGGSVATAVRSVPASGQEILVDVALALGVTSGSGALEVRSNQPLFVTSRTYNQQSSGLTYGQSNDGTAGVDGLGAGQSAYLPHLIQNGDAGQVGTFRSNIGLTNAGAVAASVTVKLYDSNGIQVWINTRSLAAGEWYQYQEPFRTGAGRNDIAKGYAIVTVNSGTGVVAYGSVLDNASSDATTITMKR